MSTVFALISTFTNSKSTIDDVEITLYRRKNDAFKTFTNILDEWINDGEFNVSEAEEYINQMKEEDHARIGKYTYEIRDLFVKQ